MEGVQLSFFDEVLPDEEIRLREILKRGSGFQGGCLRIYAAEQTLEGDRFAEYLPDEFGVGGHSVKNGFADYNGKGFLIRDWGTDREQRYSWRKVAQVYREMIRAGEFPEPEVIALYQEARKAGKGAPRPRMHYFGGEDR